MQKILNDVDAFVDEMLDGILAAHPDQLRRPSRRAIVRADAPVSGKVAIATGGGSGHLPVFMGYVGRGLIDGAAIGNVFASPSSDDMLEVTRAISAGKGVLYLYGNYGGDRLNFDLAAELAAEEGIEVAHDPGCRRRRVGSTGAGGEPARDRGHLLPVQGRRGRGGSGRVAGRGRSRSRSELRRAPARWVSRSRRARSRRPASRPSSCPSGEMEIGMGIHGEPGVRRGPLETADQIADELTRAIVADLPFDARRRGRGPRQRPRRDAEGGALHPVPRRRPDPRRRGLRVHRVWVGEYATSLEMAGASLTLMRLDDDLRRLVDAPAGTPFFVQA